MKINSVLLACILGLLAACSDEVTTQFNDLAHAKRENAFKRGWLPPILPESSRNIVEINDLDVNQGNGSFEYNIGERAQYIDKLIENYSGKIKESNDGTTVTIVSSITEWSIFLPTKASKATYGVGSIQKQTEQGAAANP